METVEMIQLACYAISMVVSAVIAVYFLRWFLYVMEPGYRVNALLWVTVGFSLLTFGILALMVIALFGPHRTYVVLAFTSIAASVIFLYWYTARMFFLVGLFLRKISTVIVFIVFIVLFLIDTCLLPEEHISKIVGSPAMVLFVVTFLVIWYFLGMRYVQGYRRGVDVKTIWSGEELGFHEEGPPRYGDFTFYKEGKLLQPGHVLNVDEWYKLEVAIRQELIGIPHEGEEQPIIEPKQKKDVVLYVAAESDDFEITNPVCPLVLPPKGDSKENANFKVCPRKVSINPRMLATITIRIYYEFNLLQVGRIEAEVVKESEDDTHSYLGLKEPIKFTPKQRVEGDLDIDHVNILPRKMHIDITQEDDNFYFTFIFWNEKEKKVEFPNVRAKLSKEELEDLLVRLRKRLWRIVMSEMYDRELEGDEIEFARQMNELAYFGRKLWVRLFRKSSGSPLWNVGKWLEGHPLEEGAIIQISVGDGAETFIFPWNLVYDKKYPDNKNELPDLEGFWGLHYVIEQRLPVNEGQSPPGKRDAPFDLDEGFEIAFMLWPFLYAPEQEEFIRDLATRYDGKMTNDEPITTSGRAYYVLTDRMSHILYFYTHGYTRPREADIGGLDFVKWYETLPEKSPIRQSGEWSKLYIQARESEEDSFIELRHGKLTLDGLRDKVEILPKYPIVFLNMCESAQATPSLSGSFIDFFIDRGARCVIGTECSMRPLFAHHFSKKFFEALLAGATVGEALLHVRNRFMKLHNPLGLAYTLFGSATARFIQPEDTKN